MRVACASCGGRAHHLPRFEGVDLLPFCCVCMDAWMADLSTRVPPEEGAEGLARFRAEHWRDCNYRPLGVKS